METVPTIDAIQEAVRSLPRVRVAAGGSKPALSGAADVSLAGLSGILEYEPGEFTFTALAGTPVAEVQRRLAEHGQYLPFDPPLAAHGATLGGTVAAGLSGSGRYRYGGVRDFLLGVRLVNGRGALVRGGGKVVKNVAGFEVPKLMVGSLGRFGIMVELTFKVFPAPAASATVRVDCPDLPTALATMDRLAVSPLDLACLDLEPPGRLWIRLSGLAASLPQRVRRLHETLEPAGSLGDLPLDEESRFWQDAREFAWVPEDHALVKVPLVPTHIPRIEQQMASCQLDVPRRYSVGGNVAWLAWPDRLEKTVLQQMLAALDRPALALFGSWSDPTLGKRDDGAFAERLLSAFDPDGRFRPCRQTAES